MKGRHILIVELESLFAEMFHLWMLHAPNVGMVSCIDTWDSWWDVEGQVHGVFSRAKNLPPEDALPSGLLERHPIDSLVLLGESSVMDYPGCSVKHLRGVVEREDVLYGLGLIRPGERIHEERQLTDKESKVACMAAKGCSMKEMADHLECTVSTVQTYKARVMEKMGVTTLSDLSVHAAAKGLRDCPCRNIIHKGLSRWS